jgi:hypothetical protein
MVSIQSAHGSSSVPPAVLQEYGSTKAHPRVCKAYVPIWGFRTLKPRPVLTTETAMRLREQGVTEVELVWRWRRRRMTLTDGHRSVWLGEAAQRLDTAQTTLSAAA